jgi:pyruvate dehydrogenase E1 component alpha subunit
MFGETVDGKDVEAVYRAAQTMIERARSGQGPSFLECRTYRWRGHVGPSWDMDVGVKRRDELKEWLEKDPVARTKNLLVQAGVPESYFARLKDEVLKEVQDALDFAKNSPYPEAGDLLRHVYKQP